METLKKYFIDLEKALSDKYVGKRVRVSVGARSVPSDKTRAEGIVEHVAVGSFGYDGAGHVLITFNNEDFIMLNKNYSTIEITS